MYLCMYLIKNRVDIAYHFLHQMKQKALRSLFYWALSYFGRCLFLSLQNYFFCLCYVVKVALTFVPPSDGVTS